MSKVCSLATAACLVAAGFLFSLGARGADTPATKPAATQAAALACCGDACKQMAGCCKADDKGKVTCSMGGSCCVKADSKKADDKGMGGMDMGK
jgi:hypothetical protein